MRDRCRMSSAGVPHPVRRFPNARRRGGGCRTFSQQLVGLPYACSATVLGSLWPRARPLGTLRADGMAASSDLSRNEPNRETRPSWCPLQTSLARSVLFDLDEAPIGRWLPRRCSTERRSGALVASRHGYMLENAARRFGQCSIGFIDRSRRRCSPNQASLIPSGV